MGVRRIAGGFIALAVLGAAVLVSASPVSGDTVAPTNTQSFLIDEATVATAEEEAPINGAFTLDCPVEDATPTWLEDEGHPSCQSGELTIRVTASTKYYDQECTTSGCSYPASTYEETVVPGDTLRIGGQWTRVGYANYEFTARYVWHPGTGVTDPPPNPQPSQPCLTAITTACLQDYNFSRRFVVDATIAQVGTRLFASGPWSEQFGFVVNDITDYYANDHVERIAAAHRDPVTLDPQLVITTNDVSSPSNPNLGLTRFYVETYFADCGCYKFKPSTKAETVQPGAEVRAAGSYAWTTDADWRFVASYVWRPAPDVATGRFLYNVQAPRSETGLDGSVRYEGSSLTGDGQINPASVIYDLLWTFDEDTGTWTATGGWNATRSAGSRGGINGSLQGSWDPSTSRFEATLVLESGSGIFCGATGAGTLVGNLLGDALDPPVQSIAGAVNIEVSRTTAGC